MEEGDGYMWHEIKDNNDILAFMDKMGYFHDSCIKEMKYLSGAYVNNDLSMYSVNNRRVLKIIIQRQTETLSMIEMEFEGLKCLKLFPIDEQYTCEILDSTMFFGKQGIYWCDAGDLSEEDLESYVGTMLCASRLRWRSIERCMGDNEFYCSIE